MSRPESRELPGSDGQPMVSVGPLVVTGPGVFKQVVTNGSGRGIVAVGVNPRSDGTHHISIYDVSDPTDTTAFETTIPTPGIARAAAIFNGFAYVADGGSGLQVVNYLAYDTGGEPPSVSLSAGFPIFQQP